MCEELYYCRYCEKKSVKQLIPYFYMCTKCGKGDFYPWTSPLVAEKRIDEAQMNKTLERIDEFEEEDI